MLYLPLFAISGKFSSQYNKILGYKWNSAQRVIGILQKWVLIKSMLKLCAVFKYYDLNAIKKNQKWLERSQLPSLLLKSLHNILYLLVFCRKDICEARVNLAVCSYWADKPTLADGPLG